mmetsp:Transcript_7554/g.19565  ORF Transcript_7554/g.19565 Transcript_7554/m.19565 type:complete len:138 (-) Transcript_7554:349-762(-)
MEFKVEADISDALDSIERVEKEVAGHFEKLEGAILSPVPLDELSLNEEKLQKSLEALREKLQRSMVGFLPSAKPPKDQTCEEAAKSCEEATRRLDDSLRHVVAAAQNEGKLLRNRRQLAASADTMIGRGKKRAYDIH